MTIMTICEAEYEWLRFADEQPLVPPPLRLALQAGMTTLEAAELLDVTRGRILQLITAGRLKARKVGRDWWIEPRALDRVRERKPGNHTGRPRTSKTDSA